MKTLWRRFRDVIVHRILHADDTPHRLALGVLLGFLIAPTPTLGLQIVIYVGAATMLGANKFAGVPFLFISNPFTAVPLYWFVWKVGAYTLNFGPGGRAVTEQTVSDWLGDTGRAIRNSDWESVLAWEFWSDVGRMLVSTGGELWLGALVVGLLTGLPAYFFTRWGVGAFREAREARRLSRVPPE